jgi:Fe-S cluster biogenesis protein NfuA
MTRSLAINQTETIELVLDSAVRPFLDSHGGDVQVASVSDDGVVTLKFAGACSSCPALPATLHMAVAPFLGQIPGVTKVVSQNVNISKYALARLNKLLLVKRENKQGKENE